MPPHCTLIMSHNVQCTLVIPLDDNVSGDNAVVQSMYMHAMDVDNTAKAMYMYTMDIDNTATIIKCGKDLQKEANISSAGELSRTDTLCVSYCRQASQMTTA